MGEGPTIYNRSHLFHYDEEKRRKERERREIKARQRCATCRNYWPWCECSTGSQIAQLLAPRPITADGQTGHEPYENGRRDA